MKKITLPMFLFPLFFFCLLGLANAQGQAPDEIEDPEIFEKLTYSSEAGGSLDYRLMKPIDYDPNKNYPMVLFLHGSGERGSDNVSQLKNGVAHFTDDGTRKKYNFYMVVPQCPENHRWAEYHANEGAEKYWLNEDPSEPMKLLMELISEIKSEHNIDEKKIYINGLSMGGQGTYDLLMRLPDTFAAAVVLCSSGDVRRAPTISHIPFWVFHGQEDETVPIDYARVMVNALEMVGAKVKYTEYPDVGHNVWDYAYKEPKLMGWMFKQKKR